MGFFSDYDFMENEGKIYWGEKMGHVGLSTGEESYRALNSSEIWRTVRRSARVGGWDHC